MHNRNDLVPQVPWFLGYTHPPSQVRLDSSETENRLFLPEITAVSVFGDGLVSEAVRSLPHRATAVAAAAGPDAELRRSAGHGRGSGISCGRSHLCRAVLWWSVAVY